MNGYWYWVIIDQNNNCGSMFKGFRPCSFAGVNPQKSPTNPYPFVFPFVPKKFAKKRVIDTMGIKAAKRRPADILRALARLARRWHINDVGGDCDGCMPSFDKKNNTWIIIIIPK